VGWCQFAGEACAGTVNLRPGLKQFFFEGGQLGIVQRLGAPLRFDQLGFDYLVSAGLRWSLRWDSWRCRTVERLELL